MTDEQNPNQVAVQVADPKAVRKALRDNLLGNKIKPRVERVTIFDQEIEIRQPSLKDIMAARDEDDPAKRAAQMVINYAYVPDTDEKVFEPTDEELILRWPFGEDMLRLQQAISNLTGLDVDTKEGELKEDPLEE